MFDSYLCKRFKEKRITVKMLRMFIRSSISLKIHFIIYCLAALMLVAVFYVGCLCVGVTLAVSAFVLAVIINEVMFYLTDDITVAACPLNKK